jgi:hypothetical protein
MPSHRRVTRGIREHSRESAVLSFSGLGSAPDPYQTAPKNTVPCDRPELSLIFPSRSAKAGSPWLGITRTAPR